MYTFYVRRGDLCTLHSEPSRFVISEMHGETTSLITMYDKQTDIMKRYASVTEAMIAANQDGA